MLNKKKDQKNYDQVLPYIKPQVTIELKERVIIFDTKMGAFSEAIS